MELGEKSIERPPNTGFFVGIGFLVVAVILFSLSPSVDIPTSQTPDFDKLQIVPGSRRVALSDPPTINSGTFVQRCSDCHSLFENTRDPSRSLTQHTGIQLDHGANNLCLSCHDKDDRERLSIRGGSSIGFDQAEQLCAQCHGPIYNDWIRGTHGKTIGYWNTELGPATKLKCSECHDPHSPAYEPIVPLPGPHTLRMGIPHSNLDAINEKNPLQRWRTPQDANSTHNTEHEGDH